LPVATALTSTNSATTSDSTVTAVEPIYSNHSWRAHGSDDYDSTIFAAGAKCIKPVAITRRTKDIRTPKKKAQSKEGMNEIIVS